MSVPKEMRKFMPQVCNILAFDLFLNIEKLILLKNWVQNLFLTQKWIKNRFLTFFQKRV